MQFKIRRFAAGALSISAILVSVSATAQLVTQHYKQTNLVSNQPGVAAVTDPNLVNPWGLSRSSSGPWWDSDNNSGLSTLYSGTGEVVPLVVTIPPGPGSPSGTTGSPTGTIYNGGTGFPVAPGKPAFFIFVTEDGTISGWNPSVNPESAVIVVNTDGKSVFKGATIATLDSPLVGPQSLLYVADFRKGRIQVYDANFKHVSDVEQAFRDEKLPEGYAPFNVQNIGGNLYVTYALQDSAKHDEVDGAGYGYLDLFAPCGTLLRRFEHGPWFNAPWGLVEAPGDFGVYSHNILVGNFGSGEILAFDSFTGHFSGRLKDSTNTAIKIEGLWGLSFGNDAAAGPATSLYFAAGPNNEKDGLLGTIVAVENVQGNDQ